MSARDPAEPLVDLVFVDGAATSAGHPDVPGEVGASDAPRPGWSARFLVLLPIVAVVVLLLALVGPGHRPSAASGPSTKPTAVGGHLLSGQRVEAQRQAAEALRQRESAAAGRDQLTQVRPVTSRMTTCPGNVFACAVTFGRLPARVTAAVTTRIPGAEQVHKLDATGFDGGLGMYFRQIRFALPGCVVTLQLTRGVEALTKGKIDVTVHSASGRSRLVRQRATGGFTARLRLTGSLAACPSDSAVSALVADPRLLATS